MARFLVLVLAACGTAHSTLPEPDPCALPAGLVVHDLAPQIQELVVRRALACTDHANGRLSDADYRKLVSGIDAQLAHAPVRTLTHHEPQPLVEWATTVLDVSTQYGDPAWSANQVLGPPDVFPAYGDHDKAWGTHGPDDPDEYIEVGFDHPGSVQAIEVFETFNPGAIDQVEIITTRGHRIAVPLTGPQPTPGVSAHRTFTLRCTKEPIASVRIHLDSQHVSGWNELDAIGVVPCIP